MQALRFRREHRELFQSGAYTPLHATGPKGDHVVAFAREHQNQVAIIVVPRLSYSLAAGSLRRDASGCIPTEFAGAKARNSISAPFDGGRKSPPLPSVA